MSGQLASLPSLPKQASWARPRSFNGYEVHVSECTMHDIDIVGSVGPWHVRGRGSVVFGMLNGTVYTALSVLSVLSLPWKIRIEFVPSSGM